MTTTLFPLGHWLVTQDGNLEAFKIFRRHYSFHEYADGRRLDTKNPNRHLFVGPGEKLVLISPDNKALFVWRKFIDGSGQNGINCAVFRNEGRARSSELIRAAEEIALLKWPAPQRFYTYVNAEKIRSENPGACFQKAGWDKCGKTKGGLIILEKECLE